MPAQPPAARGQNNASPRSPPPHDAAPPSFVGEGRALWARSESSYRGLGPGLGGPRRRICRSPRAATKSPVVGAVPARRNDVHGFTQQEGSRTGVRVGDVMELRRRTPTTRLRVSHGDNGSAPGGRAPAGPGSCTRGQGRLPPDSPARSATDVAEGAAPLAMRPARGSAGPTPALPWRPAPCLGFHPWGRGEEESRPLLCEGDPKRRGVAEIVAHGRCATTSGRRWGRRSATITAVTHDCEREPYR